MLRAIHIFPQFENIKLIDRVREQYDPLFALISPHITLVFPFESDLCTAVLQQHVEQALREVGPFRLTVQGVTAVSNRYLFLNVQQGGDTIRSMHEKLNSGILQEFCNLEYSSYIPHVTIGRFENDHDLASAYEKTRSLNDSFETTVTEVASEIIDENQHSVIEFTIQLPPE